MEIIARTPETPRGKPGEAGLTRRLRLKGAPRELRVVGDRRLPRSAGAGAIGTGIVVLFFAGLAANSMAFLVMLLAATAVLAFCVWALIQLPIRPTVEQRWRPRRRIRPLELAGWKVVAERLGAELRAGRLPSLEGELEGVRFRLSYHQRGGARTVAVAMLPAAAPARLLGYPRRADYRTKGDYFTGDEGFDREWHVICAHAPSARRLLGRSARRWITATGPDEFLVRKRQAAVRLTAFQSDADRLEGMVRAVVEMARGA